MVKQVIDTGAVLPLVFNINSSVLRRQGEVGGINCHLELF